MNFKLLKLSVIALIIASMTITSCKKDKVEPEPEPELNASFDAAGVSRPAPTTAVFSNKSTEAVSYLWDFGDGTTSEEENPNHLYTQKGEYEVKLTATDANGVSDEYTKTVKIYGTFIGYKIKSVFIFAKNFGDDLEAQNSYDNDGTGADITFKIYDGNNNEVFNIGTYFPDVVFEDDEDAVVFTSGVDSELPFTASPLNQNYTIEYYDYDAKTYNYVGGANFSASQNIIPADTLAPYPASFELDDKEVAFNIEWIEE